MLKLKYQMGNVKINIYGDTPNEYLDQLSEVNIRYFVIGQTKITAENIPHFALSQDKLKSFNKVLEFSQKYKIPLIHLESSSPPLLTNNDRKIVFGVRAHLNIFTNESLSKEWGFPQNECVIIPYGFDKPKEKEEGIIFHEDIPLKEILSGALPVVKRSPQNLSIFTEFQNCLMYSSEDEKKYVYAKISNMVKEDLIKIQNNAEKLMVEKFPKDKFLLSWKELIEKVLK